MNTWTIDRKCEVGIILYFRLQLIYRQKAWYIHIRCTTLNKFIPEQLFPSFYQMLTHFQSMALLQATMHMHCNPTTTCFVTVWIRL